MRTKYRCIARVEKTHGKKGEVVTVPVHGLPRLVRMGLEVAVVPPVVGSNRWHEVLEVTSSGKNGDLVRLSGSTCLSDAESLVGRYLLAPESELPSDLALHDPARLIGRAVTDDEDRVGTIVEVLTGPANDVWVVRGPEGEILLPVIDHVVSSVPDSGPIMVKVPAGLSWERGGR